MELEFLFEFSIWCPDGLNISELRQATGLMNIKPSPEPLFGAPKDPVPPAPPYAPSPQLRALMTPPASLASTPAPSDGVDLIAPYFKYGGKM